MSKKSQEPRLTSEAAIEMIHTQNAEPELLVDQIFEQECRDLYGAELWAQMKQEADQQ